jgi:hypothetical protein
MTTSGANTSWNQRAAIAELQKSEWWKIIAKFLEDQVQGIETQVFDINNPQNSDLLTINMNFLQFIVQTRNIYKTVLELPEELLDNTIENVNKQMEMETEALIKKLQW